MQIDTMTPEANKHSVAQVAIPCTMVLNVAKNNFTDDVLCCCMLTAGCCVGPRRREKIETV